MGNWPGRHRGVRAMSAATASTIFVLGMSACSDSTPKKPVTTCPPNNPAPSRSVAWNTIYANVYNASDTKGEAAQVAKRLGWRGLHILDVKNDPLKDERSAPKYAEVRYGKAGRTIALNIAQQLPHASLFEDERTDATIDVVIGNKFTLTPEPPAPIKDVKVHVYNTTFMPGLATKVSGQLKQRGFPSDDKPNDKAYYPKDTAVIVYDEEGLPEAQRLQLHVKGARLLQDTSAGVDVKGREVNLYLGSLWPTQGELVPEAQATPKPTPSASPSC